MNHIVRMVRERSLSALVAEAKRLIAFTPVRVSELGFRLGFADPSYFMRHFRLHVGETRLLVTDTCRRLAWGRRAPTH